MSSNSEFLARVPFHHQCLACLAVDGGIDADIAVVGISFKTHRHRLVGIVRSYRLFSPMPPNGVIIPF